MAGREDDEAQRIPPRQGAHEIGIIPDGWPSAALEGGEVLADESMQNAHILSGIRSDMQLSGER
jgi:hypothetical protein